MCKDDEPWARPMTAERFIETDFYQTICGSLKTPPDNPDRLIKLEKSDYGTRLIISCPGDWAHKWEKTAENVLSSKFHCRVSLSYYDKKLTANFHATYDKLIAYI